MYWYCYIYLTRKKILRDFNAKVGKESIYKPTIGNESLHNETNNNGIKIIQFVISKDLNVRSTTFPHKDIHTETWYSADGRTANQISHVLINNSFRSAITDIRALRGPDIGSHHNLLKINFKVKLWVKTGNKHNEKRKMVNIFLSSHTFERALILCRPSVYMYIPYLLA